MIAKERLYVWLNNGTFAEKDGCTHPQDIIAAAIGCTERTVIRSVQQLEAEGRVRVHRPRRRGACNTYYVSCWNPARRSGVLNVIAAVKPDVLKRRRERDERLCQIKRTAKPSGSADPQATPSSLKVVNRRCGRASRDFGVRRFSMDQRRHLRLEVDCEECARKDQIIRQYAENHSKLVEEVSGAQEVARAVGKENATLKRRRTREAREDARAEQIMQVGEYWLQTHPRAKFPEGEKRWELVRKALGTYSVTELLEALEGARLKPFVRYGTRIAKAVPGCGRKDDLADVLRDETTIEECRGICQRARMSPAERLWAAYRALSIPAEAYWRLAVDAAVEVPDDGLVDVDGVATRVD